MKINLPDMVIQPDWTIPGQIKKILEEAGEVAEAITENNPVNTIREALDTMQTCATLINMVLDDRNIKLDKFLIEHREKLISKGYLREGQAYE
jgi:NTP pyrophosphatase (non-canonical NTP hydrolase)